VFASERTAVVPYVAKPSRRRRERLNITTEVPEAKGPSDVSKDPRFSIADEAEDGIVQNRRLNRRETGQRQVTY
jgi:hypothetical protein